MLSEVGQAENDALWGGEIIKVLKEMAEVGEFFRAWE